MWCSGSMLFRRVNQNHICSLLRVTSLPGRVGSLRLWTNRISNNWDSLRRRGNYSTLPKRLLILEMKRPRQLGLRQKGGVSGFSGVFAIAE